MAEAASARAPGPWRTFSTGPGRLHVGCEGDPFYVVEAARRGVVDYIAAANPVAVLALLDEVDRLRSDAALVEARWLTTNALAEKSLEHLRLAKRAIDLLQQTRHRDGCSQQALDDVDAFLAEMAAENLLSDDI